MQREKREQLIKRFTVAKDYCLIYVRGSQSFKDDLRELEKMREEGLVWCPGFNEKEVCYYWKGPVQTKLEF
jgi:hypothetical protein